MDLSCLTPEEFALARERITLVAAVLPEALELLPGTTLSVGGVKAASRPRRHCGGMVARGVGA